MARQGKITSWQDDQGYGFITPHGGGEPVFVHIKAFVRHQPRPAGGEIVTFDLTTDPRGRLRADNVAFVADRRNAPPRRRPGGAGQTSGETSHAGLALGAAALFFTGLGWLVWWHRWPTALPWLYGGASLVAYCAYGLDKAAAQSGRWRIRESTLHLFALVGGWPGALVASQQFRHKTRKGSFRLVFWATVLLNLMALGACR